MALSLKGSDSCQSGDKVAPFLNRLVSCGDGHKVMPGVTARGDLLPPSEYEKHVEGEQWSKMMHDRSKDLVLTFGEEDVRVFRRIGPHAKKGKLPSHLNTSSVPEIDDNAGISTAPKPKPTQRRSSSVTADIPTNINSSGKRSSTSGERHDVTGLATIGNPSVFTSLKAPRCVVEKAKELERINREEEAKAERQRRLDIETGILAHAATSSRPTTSDTTSNTAGARVGTTTPEGQPLASEARSRRGDTNTTSYIPLKKATLAKVEPVVDPTAPAPFIPPRVFAQLIMRRCREADPNSGASHAERMKAEQMKSQVVKGKQRRRHHRIGCVHHRLSTNTLARSKARERTFPAKALNQSVLRLRHAIHGAPSSTVEVEDPSAEPESCFVLPDVSDVVGTGGAGGLDVTHRSMGTTMMGNESFMDSTIMMGDSHLGTTRSEVCLDEDSSTTDVFAMTRPDITSVLDRSKTPNLQPFLKEDNINAEAGCECTDRSSTDDDVPLRQQLRDAQKVFKKKIASGASSKTHVSKASPANGEDPPLEPLMAANASEALRKWTTGFNQTKVIAGVRLDSRLGTRESHRSFVCDERRHLHLVASAAESCGEEYYLSRQCRSTTPAEASMWAPVHSAIEGDRRYMALTQTKYGDFCNFCTTKRFPSDAEEMAFMDDLRQRCMKDGSSRPASRMYNDMSTVPLRSPPRSRASSPAAPSTGGASGGGGDNDRRSSSIVALDMPSHSINTADQALGRLMTSSMNTTSTKPPKSLSMKPHKKRANTTTPEMSVMDEHLHTDAATGRRSSRVTSVSLTDNLKTRASTAATASGGRSVFFPSTRDRSRDASWSIEAPKEVKALSEATALELLESHGETLLSTRRGLVVANQLREMCNLSAKDFFLLIQRHEADWGPYIPEVAHLRKKLQA